jgi:hypothetical protein
MVSSAASITATPAAALSRGNGASGSAAALISPLFTSSEGKTISENAALALRLKAEPPPCYSSTKPVDKPVGEHRAKPTNPSDYLAGLSIAQK